MIQVKLIAKNDSSRATPDEESSAIELDSSVDTDGKVGLVCLTLPDGVILTFSGQEWLRAMTALGYSLDHR